MAKKKQKQKVERRSVDIKFDRFRFVGRKVLETEAGEYLDVTRKANRPKPERLSIEPELYQEILKNASKTYKLQGEIFIFYDGIPVHPLKRDLSQVLKIQTDIEDFTGGDNGSRS